MKHKLITALVAVFIGYFIVSNPAGAAGTAHSLLSGAAHVGNAVGAFLGHLTAGGSR